MTFIIFLCAVGCILYHTGIAVVRKAQRLVNLHSKWNISIYFWRDHDITINHSNLTLWPSFFRMLFIRSSLKTEVQAVYTRKSFFYQIIFIPQGLILVHFVLNYQLFMEENYKKAPIMLQKACMDPNQEFHVPLYNIFRADQFLLAFYNYLCFYGNLSLFRTLLNNFRNINNHFNGASKKQNSCFYTQ